jgi:hypothetical protein
MIKRLRFQTVALAWAFLSLIACRKAANSTEKQIEAK